MNTPVCALPALLVAALFTVAPGGSSSSRPASPQSPPSAVQPFERVRQAIRHSWDGYVSCAWGHDFLKPISKGSKDWYGVPLNITPIDALDTLLLAGERAEADRARRLIVEKTAFDVDMSVKNFEITIRLLGGLLSSYQMTGDAALLKLADDLGTRLLPAFGSPTGMPYMYVNLRTGAVSEPNTNPAEIGTLLLEFGTLSKLTGKPVYYEKARRALVALYNRRSAIGLVGEGINCETGVWTNPVSHISGAIDSYYEYLLKASMLFGDSALRRMYDESAAAANRYLADDIKGALWYGHADMATGKRLNTHYGALDAFLPAVLALGGDLDRARRLQDSGHSMWLRFGIEPERFDYRTGALVERGYSLRPEIIESAYYLYFFTREQKYRDMGLAYLDAIEKWCRQPVGYAAVEDVESKTLRDDMDSFFIAETLKYLYLLFAPPETLDLKRVVFTTEAHPLRRTW